jgi:hypothetical protein
MKNIVYINVKAKRYKIKFQKKLKRYQKYTPPGLKSLKKARKQTKTTIEQGGIPPKN